MVYNIFYPTLFGCTSIVCTPIIFKNILYSLIVYNIFYRTLFGCTSIVCTPMIFTIAL